MGLLERKCGAFHEGKLIYGCGKKDWFWKKGWETVHLRLAYDNGEWRLGLEEDYCHFTRYTSLCSHCASAYRQETRDLNQRRIVDVPYEIIKNKKEDEVPWALKQVIEHDLFKEEFFFESLIELYQFGKFKIFYPDHPDSKSKWEKIVSTLESDSFIDSLKKISQNTRRIPELVKHYESLITENFYGMDPADKTMNSSYEVTLEYLKNLK